MSTSPDTRPAPLEIPAGLRAAGFEALLRARDRKLELAQAYGCALAAIEHEILAFVRREQAAELRRLADEVADQVKAMTDFPTLEAEADALTGVMRTLRARADELDPPHREGAVSPGTDDLYRQARQAELDSAQWARRADLYAQRGKPEAAQDARRRADEAVATARELQRRADELDPPAGKEQ